MRTMKKGLFVLLVALTLFAGCDDVTINDNVNSDGGGSARIDLTVLNAKIVEAEKTKEGVETADDAKEVVEVKQWVKSIVMVSLGAAIDKAKVARAYDKQSEVDKAAKDLSVMIEYFNSAKKYGTKEITFGDLSALITEAEAAAKTAVLSVNGSDVTLQDFWVTSEMLENLRAAIESARNGAGNVKERYNVLLDALKAFRQAKQPGNGASQRTITITGFNASFPKGTEIAIALFANNNFNEGETPICYGSNTINDGAVTVVLRVSDDNWWLGRGSYYVFFIDAGDPESDIYICKSKIDFSDTAPAKLVSFSDFKRYGNDPENPVEGPTGPVQIPIMGIELNKTSLNLLQGKGVVLRATVFPDNTTDSKEVTWSTSNPDIATVTGGMVIGISLGTAIITVTTVEGGFTATCVVTVIEDNTGMGEDYIPVTGVTLFTKTLTLEVGDVASLFWEVLPANASNKNVTWLFSASGIIEVSSNWWFEGGYVRALAEGTVTITIKTAEDEGGFTDTCVVTVTAPSDEYMGEGPGWEEPINIDDSGGIEIPGQGSGNVILIKDDDLTLSVTIDGDDPITNYQWYKAVSADSYTGATKIPGASGPTKSTYTPDTSVVGTFYYFVEVTFQSGKKQVSVIKKVTIIFNTTPGGG